jgi:hypothetical protein
MFVIQVSKHVDPGCLTDGHLSWRPKNYHLRIGLERPPQLDAPKAQSTKKSIFGGHFLRFLG